MMYFSMHYASPVGDLLLAANEESLVGLWIEGQKYYGASLPEPPVQIEDSVKKASDILHMTTEWLDRYFAEKKPMISELPLGPIGSEFRRNVWQILCDVPYGEVITYGEIAKKMAKRMNRETMSAQAVGGAVAHNPISIIIPCHRVVGTGGSLTGYAGGIDRKIQLLELEGVDLSGYFVPKKGTAL